MNTKKNPKTKVFLQCYTTGFQKRIDEIYAYGILEVSQEKFQYSFSIKNPLTEDSNFSSLLEKKIKFWANQQASIFMFNGALEVDLCKKYIPSIKEFYSNQVIDLYTELRKYKIFIPQTTFSLKHISALAGYPIDVLLGPELYKKFYPFQLDSHVESLKRQIKYNLKAMFYAHSYYKGLLNTFKKKGDNFYSEITKAQIDENLLTINGRNQKGFATFYHDSHIYYEESSKGDYTLKLSTIYSRYKDDIFCHSIPYPFDAENPIEMPKGYILLAINFHFYPEQIHTIIIDIRSQFQ